MSALKKIAVVGATGAQGGGLARAILEDASDRFRLRALTRKPDGARATALARDGAEVVEADLDDPTSLVRAFEGCDGAFCVTNYWEHLSPERELRQARNLAGAAAEAGVGHVVWSTLEDTREFVPLEDDRMPTLMGRYKVPHFDAKGEADRLFEQLGVPTTFLLASFYWDNLIHFGSGPKRGEDGVLRLAFPIGDARMPGIAAEDIGRCALGILEDGDAMLGRRVGVAGEHLSGEEMAAALGRALGEEVRFSVMTPEAYRSLDFPGADDLGNMFQFYRDFEDEVRTTRDVGESSRLNPRLQDFEAWLAENAARIPLD